MINSLHITLVTLAGITIGDWAFAQTAVPSSNPFIYPSKGQTAQQEQKDKNECYGWASQQTGFDPAQELEDQQAAAARARQQSQQAQQTAVQQVESTQGQGVGGAAGGAAGGALIGAIAGNAGKGAAIGSAVGLLAGWHLLIDDRSVLRRSAVSHPLGTRLPNPVPRELQTSEGDIS